MTNPYSAPEAPLNDLAGSAETYQPRMFQWRGRIGRLRYLAYSVGLGLLTTVPLFVVQALVASSSMMALVVLQILIVIASITVTIVLGRRRLNDMGYTGWQVIGLIVPLVNIVVGLWLACGRGDQFANEYGPPPAPNTTGIVVGALLLPVIAIIGIVAALALPAYSGYVNRANTAGSQSL